MKHLKDYIIESLLSHIAIELNEDYGQFLNTSSVSIFISNKIKQLYDNNIYEKIFSVYRNDIRGENILFDEIEVGYEIDNTIDECKGSYVYVSDIKLNLYFRCPENFVLSDLRKTVAHEFHHYFEDMILIGKGLQSFEEIFNGNPDYKNSYIRIRDFNNHAVHPKAREIRKAFYVLNKFEQNAFISQLYEEVNILKEKRKINQKITNQEIFDIIKNTDIYKAYIDITSLIDLYNENKLSEEDKEIIINEFTILTNNKKQYTINQVMNKLEYRVKKSLNKINKVIPKKIIENLSIGYMI